MGASWWVWFAIIYFIESVLCHNYEGTAWHSKDPKTDYKPTWESLDSRPNPRWYDDAKFGIFLHWGVYSVPSFGSEWFWTYWINSKSEKYEKFMKQSYAPGFSYQGFGPEFKAEFFDADEWTKIFEGSGAKYVVLTAKHHDGYTLWPSKHSFSWNSVDVGPHRDLLKDLSRAIRKNNKMHFGVYYSLYEWFNPMYLQDRSGKYITQEYVDHKMIPEIVELIETYKPDVLWTDGDWEAEDEYWRSKNILAWIFNVSPVKDSIVVNDRWGRDITCHHGGFYTCTDRYNPQKLQKHKWENAMTVDKLSWGYRRNAELSDFLTVKELIAELVTTVSCGGNLLMNVGPRKDGIIDPIFLDRLQGMGQWLKINGEAIYKTQPWKYQNDTSNGNVWYTASKELRTRTVKSTVYAIVLEWPKNKTLYVEGLTNHMDAKKTEVFLLGNHELPLKWTREGKGIWISFPDMDIVKSQWSWCLKITNVVTLHKIHTNLIF